VSGISLSRAVGSIAYALARTSRWAASRNEVAARDNLDQYILNSRSQARRLSIAIGRGPPRPQWSPDHELRKGASAGGEVLGRRKEFANFASLPTSDAIHRGSTRRVPSATGQ
jgi:hypothetical protein